MRPLPSVNAQLAPEQMEKLVVGLDEPREQDFAAAANFPCWRLSCLNSVACPVHDHQAPMRHLTAGGRGPRMTCNHPSGTSKVLHPLRGINGHGSQGRKKETPEYTFGDTQKQCTVRAKWQKKLEPKWHLVLLVCNVNRIFLLLVRNVHTSCGKGCASVRPELPVDWEAWVEVAVELLFLVHELPFFLGHYPACPRALPHDHLSVLFH